MSSIIQLLPDHVANQIAAGEVVQRPASVVKELLENAVDAGANDIKLIIKDAGKSLVQVIDNGKGMSVTDARLCFERHATSKIRIAEDLFDLHTKGFRGEALASIAAIAHVELKTKQQQDDLGTHLIIEGSKFISQEVAVVPNGTSFSVKNLFFNIPARRNFLKSDTVEHRNIVDEFLRVVLPHPNISFTYIHNGSELYQLPSSNLRQRIVNVFGGKTNDKLIPIQEKTEIVSLSGFVSKPEFAKKSRTEQFFFVNNRYIKSPYLHHAIMSAYEGLLPDGLQPAYFIYLDVPPNTIDINIHPTKTEIKFDDEQSLYAILRASVKHSLGQFNIVPILDFEKDQTLDVPYHYKDVKSEMPAIQVNAAFNPFDKPSQNTYPKTYNKPKEPSWQSLYTGLQSDTEMVSSNLSVHFEPEEAIISSLFDEENSGSTFNKSFQINKKYIVNPIKSGLIIIDQNRAHQRILYEQFLANMTLKKGSSQQLLFPILLYFSTYELSILEELKPALVDVGFIFDEFQTECLSIVGLPLSVTESDASKVIEILINDLQNGIPENSFSLNDGIAKSMARSLAIKNGIYLNEKEQESIINSLFACKESNISPFQKPTFINLSIADIENKF